MGLGPTLPSALKSTTRLWFPTKHTHTQQHIQHETNASCLQVCSGFSITPHSTFSPICSRTHGHSIPCSVTPPRNADSTNPDVLGSDLGYTISKTSNCKIANCQRKHQLNCYRSFRRFDDGPCITRAGTHWLLLDVSKQTCYEPHIDTHRELLLHRSGSCYEGHIPMPGRCTH